MEDCANGYAAYVMELVEAAKQTCPEPVVLIEQRVDFSRWVEQGFGTSDALLISDGTLHIVDYNGGTPKYSVSLIIPKSDTRTVAKIKAAIEAAYKEGEGKYMF